MSATVESSEQVVYDPSAAVSSRDENGLNVGEPLPLATFKPFTIESYKRLEQREEYLKERAIEKARWAQEAHLVDGELKFGLDDDQDAPPPENPDLKDGCQLTKAYGRFPQRLIGKPIEEIDPGITDKTFVMISRRFSKRYINRFSATKSLFLLAPWNKIRTLLLFIATHQIFDLLIILTIVTNCVFLAMPDFEYAEKVEYLFLAIYTLECIVKILGKGFILNSHTYLRDPWNWLDFVVILTAYTELILKAAMGGNSIGNLQGLRTFRVLRALKTVSIVPGLKTIVNALLRAFKMLFEVILLTTFCLMVFAMFGLQVYQGVLRQKCVLNVSGYVTSPSQTYDHYYAEWIRDPNHWYIEDGEDDYVICGNSTGSGTCPDNYTCLQHIGENPRYGYLNFDHFGWALLTCFQLITLDFWEDIYGKVIRAAGPWNVIYFIIVIFFGSFYLINLMLAVVSMSYEEEAVSAGKEKEREKKENARNKHNAMYDMAKVQVGAKRAADEARQSLMKAKNPPSSEPNSTEKNNSASVTNPNTVAKDSHIEFKIKDGYDRLNSDFKAVAAKTESTEKNSEKISEEQNGKAEKVSTTASNSDMATGTVTRNGILIIKADTLLDPEIGVLDGQVIDRNIDGCEKFCCCNYVFFLKLQNYFYTFVQDPLFDLVITLCIILNTLFLSLEHYDQGEALTTVLNISNYIFSTVFIFEAFCKIFGMGKYYFLYGWNIFDLLIVIASIVDMAMDAVDGLNVLRSLRLLRVFKLAQSWATMRLLLTIIVSTLGALGNLCIILCIVIYIFAVIGLQLFRQKYEDEYFHPDGVPRWNFTSFGKSMIMIFRVLCGEWIEPLYDCMRSNSEICMVVFLPALVFGNFIVLNLFLALLLNAFASDSLDKQRESSAEKSKLLLGFQRLRQLCCCCCPRLQSGKVEPTEQDSQNASESQIKSDGSEGAVVSSQVDTVHDDTVQDNILYSDTPNDRKTINNGNINKRHSTVIREAFETQDHRAQFSTFTAAIKGNVDRTTELGSDSKITEISEQDQLPQSCFPEWARKRINWIEPFNVSSCGNCWYKFRCGTKKIIDHKVFEGIVLVIILGSSLTLAFEDIYLYQKKDMEMALSICNYVFTGLFIIEAALKLIGLGAAVYFTSFWTILDFFIVLISIIGLIGDQIDSMSSVTAFRSLRTLRALRPLRAISRWQGMKIVVNALMNAIPAIVNVLMVCLVFWLIFSIMGVQFFKGKFHKCVNLTSGDRFHQSIVPNKSVCLALQQTDPTTYDWQNSHVNFDNAAIGFLALFQVATFEGWMEVMADAADIPSNIDEQPSYENTEISYIYFVVFIVFGAFFSLNLFIGVIIDNFNVLKKKYEGSYLDAFLTQSQRNYYNTLKKLGKKKPQKTIKRPKNRFQLFFYNLSMSNKFELAIVIMIFFNMIVMAIDHYKQPESISDGLEIMNILFTTVFALEAVVKIIGLRLHYFRFLWNLFDFIIVVISVLGIVLQSTMETIFINPTLLRIIRVFRIGRVLRLIKAAKGIRKLLFALIISLPAIFNVGALLFLIMYMYAIIGMSSFGHVKINGIFDELVNFQTFGNSFMLLLRLATSAGWNDVLDALLIEKPHCNDTHYIQPHGGEKEAVGGDCGIPWLAIIYMCTYIVIVWLIVINMYIAIILENFNQAHEQEELGITEDDFDMFYVVWEKFDPYATQFIKYEQLADFVGDLEPPLQIPKPNEIALVSFNLPIMDGEKIHCLDILIALVKNVLADVEETDELTTLKEQMEAKFAQNFPSRVNITVKSSTLQRKKEDVAARTLQRAWRSYKAQKAMRNITALMVQQKLRRASAVGLRGRTDVMRNLGNRLTNALSNFFQNRKSMQLSPFSSQTTLQETALSKQTKIGQHLKVPQVFPLYPGDKNQNKSLEI